MANGTENAEKRWLKLNIVCAPVLIDAISDYLVGVLGAGVEMGVDDQIIHAFVEEEIGMPAGVPGHLIAHFTELADIFQVDVPIVTSEVLEDQDWGSSWKENFRPFAIIPGLIIAPSWEKHPAAPGELVIEMDPGLAFGTGHHGTTSLCVDFIQAAVVERGCRQPVLDVGTGTGILAMASALFGAREILAIDNDPEAVLAATANVANNALADRITVSAADLADLPGPYALVVANIIHDVLLAMAADLTRLTGQGGSLVLSGLLRGDQIEGIISHFVGCGFTLIAMKEKDEWAAAHFYKPIG